MDVKQIIDKKTDYWKKKLIDLSKRNNLVSYRFTNSKSLQIKEPNSIQVLEDLYHEESVKLIKKDGKPKERYWLCSDEDDIVDKKLTNLYLKSKEYFQERGLNPLFVSIGLLKYKDAEQSELFLKAPVFLYPVTLNRIPSASKEKHNFELVSESEDIQLNPALVEKLSFEFDIKLPEFKDQTIDEYLKLMRGVISGMESWTITTDVYVDIFSYEKYIMYKDLIKYEHLLHKSSLVRGFVGDRDALQDDISETKREEFDDVRDIDVLPADSSQKIAIEFAKAGVTFVLQGPPGTGKSQTISNIIAALLEKKKRVLFVSQKMAALDVVHGRLDEVGLGRYCLNLHNPKGNKKEIIKQLISELETSPHIKESVKRYSFAHYLDTQKDLNTFYEFLCEKHKPRNLSVFDIRGELAKLHNIEVIDKDISEVVKYDEERLTRLFSKLDNLDLVLEKVKSPLENAYFKFDNTKNTTLSRNRFTNLLSKTHDLSEELNLFVNKVKKSVAVSLNNPEELIHFCERHTEARKLKEVPDSFITKHFQVLHKAIAECHKNLTELHTAESNILQSLDKDFIKHDTSKLERIFKETSLFSRLFSNEYKSAKNVLREFSKEKLSHNDWLELFEFKSIYTNRLNRHTDFKQRSAKIISQIGDVDSLKNIERIHNKAEEFSELYDSAEKVCPNEPIKLIEFWLKEDLMQDSVNQLIQSLEEINGYFSKPVLFSHEEMSAIIHKLHDLRENLNNLENVLFFREEYEVLNSEVKEFIKEHISKNNLSKLKLVLQKTYYLQLLDDILKKINIASPKNKVQQFRELDFEVRDMKRFKIMESIEDDQPKQNYQSYGDNEISLLKREDGKKRRLKPIRNLLEEIPHLVFSLKPCFMMSPLSVSQYINPEVLKFDVVIFDEASQITPEDSISCLIRAKQAIVVGDTQQLPPTSFFRSGNEDDSIDEEVEDLESFLSECSTKFRTKQLLWHYRSKNEHLIAFYNRFFYENRLITFPNPKTQDDSGLDFVHVKNGIYDRGKSRKNRVEAQELTRIYKSLKKKYPDKSMGVIAFSIAQENAIREEFRIAGINVDDISNSNDEGLFIKNIETVQGDEREIIILSVGYGKDSTGKLSYNFGPLNKEGGYKRLNVAITRARFKTVVLASITPEELDEDKINVDGVRHLKHYLDYAKNKDFNKFLQKAEGIGFDSSFEDRK